MKAIIYCPYCEHRQLIDINLTLAGIEQQILCENEKDCDRKFIIEARVVVDVYAVEKTLVDSVTVTEVKRESE